MRIPNVIITPHIAAGSDRTLKRVLALLEPALIVGLGVVIGILVLSILAALLSVNELAF